MVWPAHIVEQFGTVNRGDVIEREYYGPYNGLLTELFPGASGFMVVPQTKRSLPAVQPVDSPIIFVVQHKKRPVFFVEIKPSSHLNSLADRAAADTQMREQFEAFVDELDNDILYGISALGTRIRIYWCDRTSRMISPESIPRDAKVVVDRAPADKWVWDVLTDRAGEEAVRCIVTQVHLMCGA